jgi:uncharacterized protein GlcG (DUF336 family)
VQSLGPDPESTMAALPLELARSLIDTALSAAKSAGIHFAAAAVDAGGNLVAFARSDGCCLAGLDSATGKAFTSAATGTATEQFYADQEDRAALAHAVAYPRPLVPIAGGCPVP